MIRASRLLPCLVAAAVLIVAPAASAAPDQQPAPAAGLRFKPCPDAADNVVCATLRAPLDYGRPNGDSVSLFVAKSPATGKRIGSLFLNFGGPGGTMADVVESEGADLFPVLNEHFDIIGMDPRGVGQSTPAIDCKANQETLGIYSEPFQTPFNVNPGQLLAKDQRYIAKCLQNNGPILSHVSTANVARDMDLLRQALGDAKLNYLGFSYGTFLGATYASLFPHNYRAMVLDGPVDATDYINKPMDDLAEQTAAFEREFSRFFKDCAVDQAACSGFGGTDPEDAFDALVDKANATPIPANRYTPDPRPVKGDDFDAAALILLYNKLNWGFLAEALAQAANGDGSFIRELVDEDFYGRDPDTGAFDPGSDRYFTIGATEQKYSNNLQTYFDAGDHAWGEFNHFYLNNGYVELNYGLWPAHDKDAFYGPFKVPNSSPTPLVVATTYDPATPYHGALRLVRDLGNARLLTMRGDGHTAYGNGSPDCIDPAIETYLNTLALPPAGTQCRQQTPFAAPALAPQALVAPQAQALAQPFGVLHQRPFNR
jgi:pimeloyl-ACP methyl ester carboxylesterase